MLKPGSSAGRCWCDSGLLYKECHAEHDERLKKLNREGYPIPPRHLIKSNAQIEKMKRSCRLTSDILDLLKDFIVPGITTNQINTFVHEYTIANNAKPAPLNYRGFPKSVCTSINEVICHGIPSERVLMEGDILNVDVTCILDGYYGDSSRMYAIGEISKEAQQLIDVTKRCLEIGIEAVVPFESIGRVGEAIEPYATSFGYSVVDQFVGHGIGDVFHDDPYVLHIKRKKKQMIVVPGMTFTIEPMINMGTKEEIILDDGWTAITADGELSAQWEHTVLLTPEGAVRLT